jgi:hypothetical protein
LIALVLLCAAAPALAEDRVPALARMLKSASPKTRLSAVLALAKLGERAVQPPLITALRDPNTRVRMVAATALGRLECDAALPALRALATDDADEDVRKAAGNAALKIAKSSRDRVADAEARRAAVHRPRGDGEHPDLYLKINSATDDAPGRADPVARKTHAEIVRRTLADQLRREASITSASADAQRWGLAARNIDLSVTKLDATQAGGYMEIDAQLRLAISDGNGKMLSFLSGGAKVQIPSDKFDARYLASLQKEALENAMRGMFAKLLAHLRAQP